MGLLVGMWTDTLGAQEKNSIAGGVLIPLVNFYTLFITTGTTLIMNIDVQAVHITLRGRGSTG